MSDHLATTHRPKIGGCAPFGGGRAGFPCNTICLGQGLPSYQVASWSIQPFGHKGHGPKIGRLCPFGGGGTGSPPNTIWSRPRPTCVSSFILIHPTVWPQYINVTDRQDRQWSDSIGWTILQTVAQKVHIYGSVVDYSNIGSKDTTV